MKGRSNCGKSETLGIHLREQFTGKTCPREMWLRYKDVRECISYKGKVIDICPPGDTEEIVRGNIAFVEKHPCDVVYTATRTRGRGCRALNEYAKGKKAEIVWVWKEYNDDLDEQGRAEENRQLAAKLVRFLDGV